MLCLWQGFFYGGKMKAVVSSDQMKAFDSYTIDSLGISQDVLMERAALYAFDIVVSAAKSKNSTIVVACGPGNNGGDGLALSRLLFFQGYNVLAFMPDGAQKLSDGCKKQLQICRNIGMKISSQLPEHADIVVDALFGVGLGRNIEGQYASLVDQLNGYDALKVALDIPSGVNSDNGQIMGMAFKADITISFGMLKKGQLLYPGRSTCGKLLVGDIGIYPNSDAGDVDCYSIEKNDLPLLIPARSDDSNKGTYGKLLIIAGSKDMAGAAILAAKSAYMSGVGLVNVFTCDDNRDIIMQAVPEAVLTSYNDSNYADKLEDVIKGASTVLVGPGLGQSDLSKTIVHKSIELANKNLILDADALNIISMDKSLITKIDANTFITPHMKEMSRLTQLSIDQLKGDRCKCALNYAKENNFTVIMKDASTVIAYPDGMTYINTSGNPGMSTAGAGDVLAGLLGGLLAQNVGSNIAAQLAVYLHGYAGDIAVKSKGLHGLMASDIIDALPKAMGVKNGETK